MDFKKAIEKLKRKEEELNKTEFIEKQHQKGKLTARERINLLLDPGTFVEVGPFVESRFTRFGMSKKRLPGDAVITGSGLIDKRKVFLYSQDFSKMGGTLGERHGEKIVNIIKMARETGTPLIGIIDSGGARIQEGIFSLDGYAAIFREMVKASGVIPQISVIAGPSAGGASYAPGLSDFVFMVEGISQMYITGPEVVKAVTREEISFEELGGAAVHAVKSGCAHFIFPSERNCLAGVRQLLSFLPSNNMENPPRKRSLLADFFEKSNDRLLEIVPQEEEKGYDMRDVIGEIFDNDSFLEVQSGFAKNSIIGFARLGGYVVAVVANQTQSLAGTLDIDSSDKVARFVRFSDSFNIPIINLVDTPGYLPGSEQEHKGIIRHGAKVLYAFAEATVPKIALVLRKAFGGAYIALVSKKMAQDVVLAWPWAQIAVMGPEQAVKIIYRKEITASKNPKELEKEKIKELKEVLLDPYTAAKAGQIDMIIDPRQTREKLLSVLTFLLEKREVKVAKKHGNIPL